MGDKGVNIHRTGETARRRVPKEDSHKNRKRVRNNIIIDDVGAEDLSDDHDDGVVEENLAPVVAKEKKKKSDEELVDNFLYSIFGDNANEALEKDDFFHKELVDPIAKTIFVLKIQKEQERPELSAELLALAQKAQQELKTLDESIDFSKQKLFNFLEDYKKSLDNLLAHNNDNNMSTKEEVTTPEVTTPVVERAPVNEAGAENPVEVAQNTQAKISEITDKATTEIPEEAPKIKQLADKSHKEIDEVLDEETGKMVKLSNPDTKKVLDNVQLDADANYDVMNEDFAMPSNTSKKEKEKGANQKESKAEQDLVADIKAKREKEINTLRGLIKILESAYGAPGVDGWSQKKSALQEAARILLNEKYATLANEITKDDLKKNKAIEEAILEAEDKLRALEKNDANSNAIENTVVEPAPAETPPVVEPAPIAETNPAETDPELGQKRLDFWTALHKRGNVWSTGRFLGIMKQNQEKLDDFEKIRAEYSDAQAKELEAKLKVFVAGLDPKLSEADKNFAFTQEYVRLKKAEDEEVDTIAKGLGVSGMTKFKSFWKRTALKRGALGAGLWALGAVTGGMGFLAAKVGLSSVGSYMTAESFLDTRTKSLGQKSLIDDLKNIGFKRGEKAKITEKDKDEAIKKLMTDKYSLEDLEKEWSHLRVLSLDKNKGIKEAGRFGAEQRLLVEAVQEVYYYKKAQQLAAELASGENPEVAKAGALASFLNSENNATNTATSEQDKSRMKAIKRNVVAAGIGLSVGWLASQRVLDAVAPTPEVDPEILPAVPVVEEIPDGLVGKGDTVWGMIASHLVKRVPNWDQLNVAEQTRYIDYFENKVVANPGQFGITDVDHLKEGTAVHWGNLFADKNLNEGLDWVHKLTPEDMSAITENNDILQKAAEHGVEITSKNVNEVISGIKAHGLEQYLADNGYAATQTVIENAPEVAATQTETATSIVEGAETGDVETSGVVSEVAEAGQESTGQVETLEDMGGGDKVWAFTHDQGSYDVNILKMAQRMGDISNDHGHMVDEVVNKVFESSPAVQEQFLHDLSPTDFTESNNKAEVFLKMVQESGQKLAEIDSMDKLKGLVSEYTDIVECSEGVNWTSSLFLLSSDFAIVVVTIEELSKNLLE